MIKYPFSKRILIKFNQREILEKVFGFNVELQGIGMKENVDNIWSLTRRGDGRLSRRVT